MRGAVVTKAAVRAAGLLGVRQQELAAIIGVSPSTVSRMAAGSRILAPTEKAFELAVLFVRLFRSLDANVGGDHATAASWAARSQHGAGRHPHRADAVGRGTGACHRLPGRPTRSALRSGRSGPSAPGAWWRRSTPSRR